MTHLPIPKCTGINQRTQNGRATAPEQTKHLSQRKRKRRKKKEEEEKESICRGRGVEDYWKRKAGREDEGETGKEEEREEEGEENKNMKQTIVVQNSSALIRCLTALACC